MTDLDFARYLAAKLLNSGEDCCSMCALNKRDDVCDNHKHAEETDSKLDDDVCFVGLRCYAEEQANDQKENARANQV